MQHHGHGSADSIIMRIQKEYDLGPSPLKTKIEDIGNWDMNLTPSVSIAHGLNILDIREVYATIRKDDDSEHYPIDFSIGASAECGSVYRTATNIVLSRVTGGAFDSVSYDDTPFNRGWIVIKYV